MKGVVAALCLSLLPASLFCAASSACAGDAELSREQYDFILNCQGCHRADGAETVGRVPPIKNHVARFLAVPGGREFIIRVPGVASAPLSDEAVARLMNWLLPRFDSAHLPVDFKPYTRAEVHQLRAQALVGQVAETRATLLQAMQPRPAD